MAKKAAAKLKQAIAVLPPAPAVPVEQMGMGQILTELNRKGLGVWLQEVERYKPDADLNERRHISHIVEVAIKINVRLAEDEYRQRRDDRIGLLLEELKKERD